MKTQVLNFVQNIRIIENVYYISVIYVNTLQLKTNLEKKYFENFEISTIFVGIDRRVLFSSLCQLKKLCNYRYEKFKLLKELLNIELLWKILHLIDSYPKLLQEL